MVAVWMVSGLGRRNNWWFNANFSKSMVDPGWFRVKGTHLRTDRLKFGFFGPKPINWTTRGALRPILALLGRFRGDFGPRVGFGAHGESSFPNNEMAPLLLISLFSLHLNSCKRYIFETRGPKWALNSQNWPKMTQNRFMHMAIFWKTRNSDLPKNRPKYMSRTILHFDLGLGPYPPEKFFTTKKINFLVEPICPLGEIDAQARCWPRRVPKALKQFSGVYYMIICHFGPSWGHLGTHGGPQMAQNSTKMV